MIEQYAPRGNASEARLVIRPQRAMTARQLFLAYLMVTLASVTVAERTSLARRLRELIGAVSSARAPATSWAGACRT